MSVPRAVRAEAFAPGHVTGVFAPAVVARDPRGRGSTGAGVVLELGALATAEFRPGAPNAVRIVSDVRAPLPISMDVARRLRPRARGTLTVRLRHELPIGQGFGMSAAGALATALAVTALTGASRTGAVRAAHLADLFGEGGLGGVAAIAGGGGVEFRVRGGIPPWGRVVRRDLPGRLLVGVVGGPLPSPRLLRNPRFLARVRDASAALPSLLEAPDVVGFFDASERFTDRLGLASPVVRRVLRGLRRRGWWAAQAMFGRSFFARPKLAAGPRDDLRWLSRGGFRVVGLSAAATGAHVTHRGSLSR